MSAADWIAERRRIEQAATDAPWRAAVVARYTDADGGERGKGGIYPGGPSGPPPIFITPDWLTADAEFIADARTAMPKMRAALEAVLALHPWEYLECEGIDLDASPRCGHCYEPWPCPTVVLIREALT